MSKLLESKRYTNGSFEVYSDKPEFDIIHCHQTHSNRVIEYNGDKLNDIQADGIIVDYKKYPNTTITIKTADCLPVLFIGDKIALVHAGWKGLKTKILLSPGLLELNIKEVYIGPAIKEYEVQPEFKENFPHSKNFFQKYDSLYFQLEKEAIEQIKSQYPYAKITCSDICTLKNNQYNSYRRNKTDKRNWNIFNINKD